MEPVRPRCKEKEYGSDLVLRKQTNASERKFSDALDYTVSKDARTLVFAVAAKKEETTAVFTFPRTARLTAGPSSDYRQGKIPELTWAEDQTQLP